MTHKAPALLLGITTVYSHLMGVLNGRGVELNYSRKVNVEI